MTKIPGIGDPYWYEWLIGLRHIIKLLPPDTELESVALQADVVSPGLDDIVVTYKDRRKRLIQVKHSRENDTLTFGDMVSAREGSKPSLLRKMCSAWLESEAAGFNSIPSLVTNRPFGQHPRTVTRADGTTFARPSLNQFWPEYQTRIRGADALSLVMFQNDWRDAWSEWLNQLSDLPSDEVRLQFLKKLEVYPSEPDLDAVNQELLGRLAEIFGISVPLAETVLNSLKASLSTWATTCRTRPEVYSEDVCDAIRIHHSPPSQYQHYLFPPEPFFDSRLAFCRELGNDARHRKFPIIYLTGDPGSGKTSLISALADCSDAAIDFRFYAFKPITPESSELSPEGGGAATGETLWGDLLTQMRWHLKGRLHELRVPLRNDFLSAKDLRKEVLRLAAELAKLRSITTVIAIDGLDHAARANIALGESFLASLVQPEAVPQGVCFVLAGQDPTANPTYPLWLRSPDPKLLEVQSVPDIAESDITAIYEHSAHAIPPEEKEAAVRIIRDHAQGNTLAVVFANSEATTCTSATELSARLEERRLKSGISTYYESIWNSATQSIEKTLPFAGHRLAAAIALAPEQLSGDILARIFKSLAIPAADWTAALRRLRPLVLEEQGKFRPLVNDVRVFLHQLASVDKANFSEVASNMADYYMEDEADAIARHASLLRLLIAAGRNSEVVQAFTPFYVLEGAAIGRPMHELLEHSKLALKSIQECEEPAWHVLQNLSCALRTLHQFRQSLSWQELDEDALVTNRVVPRILTTEARVIPAEDWTSRVVSTVALDAIDLADANELNRARGLLRTWFGALTPARVGELISGDADSKEYAPAYGRTPLPQEVGRALYFLGKATQCSGLRLERGRKAEDSGFAGYFEAAYTGGQIDAALDSGSAKSLLRALRESECILLDDLERALEPLAFRGEWPVLAFILRWAEPARAPLPFRVKAAVLGQLLTDERIKRRWELEPSNLEELFTQIGSSDVRDKLEFATWVCIAVACESAATDPAEVRDRVLDLYHRTSRDSRERAHCGRIFHAAAVLGNALSCYCRGGRDAIGVIPFAESIAFSTHLLLYPDGKRPASVPYRFAEVAEKLISCFDQLTTRVDAAVANPFINELVRFAAEHRIGAALEVCWRRLAKRGNHSVLNEWAEAWIGDQGKAWDLDLAGRMEVVKRFAALCREAGFNKLASNAQLRVNWGCVGYSGHKEYSLDEPLDWFREAAKVDPHCWDNQGILLLALSKEASEQGDNRLGLHVNAEVATAVSRCGPSAFGRLLNATGTERDVHWIRFDDWMAIDGLCGLVEQEAVTEADALAIWCFAVGFLSWQDSGDRVPLFEIREALRFLASRLDYANLDTAMASLAPAEHSVTCDHDRYRRPGRLSLAEPDESSEFGVKAPQRILKELLEAATFSTDYPSPNWRAFAAILEKLRDQQDEQTPALVAKLRARLLIGSDRCGWSFDGRTSTFANLAIVLSEQEYWTLARDYVARLQTDDPDLWLSAAAENLNTLCLARARESGIAELLRGADQVLHTHQLWVEGAGRFKQLNRVEFKTDHSTTDTWPAVLTDVLSRLLQFDESTAMQACLRGLWAMVRTHPDCFAAIRSKLTEFDRRSIYRVLLICERAAIEPAVFGIMRDFVIDCKKSPYIEIAIQASIVLRAAERANGAELSEITIGGAPAVVRLHHRAPEKLIFVPEEARGMIKTGHGLRSAESLLRRIESVVGDLDGLESELAQSMRDSPIIERGVHRRYLHRADMVSATNQTLNRVFDLLSVRIHSGQIRPNLADLAQALLLNDEPWLLLHSPAANNANVVWPVDYELQRLIEARGNEIEHLLVSALKSDLPAGTLVMAGTITAYSTFFDIQLNLDHVWKRSPLLQRVPWISTVGGRSFPLYNRARFEPNAESEDKRFTFAACGYGEFVHQQLEPYPALFWENELGWTPNPHNPLEYIADGKRVAWYERRHGPFRDAINEPGYRQPQYSRWVVSKDAFQGAEKRLRGAFRETSEISVEKFR